MKKLQVWLLLLFGAAGGTIYYWLLAQSTDFTTGLALESNLLPRYGILAVFGLLALAGLFVAVPRPTRWETKRGPACIICFLLGCLLGMGAGLRLVEGFGNVPAMVLAAFQAAAAFWYILLALYFQLPYARNSVSWFGVAGCLWFGVQLMPAFFMQVASLWYCLLTVQLAALAAAMLFSVGLPRAFLYPESNVGRGVTAAGLLCFYFCTCLYLPQTVLAALWVGCSAEALLNGAAAGLLGLLGAAMALGSVE